MYAVIATGGKQYRVEKNSTLQIEKLDAEPGSTVQFEEVLLIADGDEDAASRTLEQARERATPLLIDVLRRYPTPAPGSSRAAQLMATLDAALRASR